MHAILRVPVTIAVSPAVVGRIAQGSTTTIIDPEFPGDPGKRHAVGWGRRVDCQSVGVDAREAARVTGYMAKVISYSNKSITDEWHPASRRHAALLDRSARSMWCDRCPRGRTVFSGPRYCKSATHNRYGARSSIVSASRLTFNSETGEVKKTGWSTAGLNRSSQRAARSAWAATNKASTDTTTMSSAMALSVAARRYLEGPHAPPHVGPR